MSLVRAMNVGLDAIYEVMEKPSRPSFEDKNILDQRVTLGYYLEENPSEIMEALNDYIDRRELLRHWRANDGTAVLSMLDKAFAKYCGPNIDALERK